MSLLAHPNIASKHWIIRQYDHEVGGGSVIKPLVGPLQIGPSDAAVLRPKHSSFRGVALGCGMAPQIEDPYDMALASIDEAIRNVIAVGADYDQIAILDNFCWPSVDDENTMGTLVRACEACRDAALAYGIPFISGKDSLHNQFTDRETGKVIKIPRTLLISAIGIVPDVRKCVTMDFKAADSPIFLIAAKDSLAERAQTHRTLAALLPRYVAACHDVSDGGYAVALAEMAIATGIGVTLDMHVLKNVDPFKERPGRYVVELKDGSIRHTAYNDLRRLLGQSAVVTELGQTQAAREFSVINRSMPYLQNRAADVTLSIEQMTRAWRGTLDW